MMMRIILDEASDPFRFPQGMHVVPGAHAPGCNRLKRMQARRAVDDKVAPEEVLLFLQSLAAAPHIRLDLAKSPSRSKGIRAIESNRMG